MPRSPRSRVLLGGVAATAGLAAAAAAMQRQQQRRERALRALESRVRDRQVELLREHLALQRERAALDQSRKQLLDHAGHELRTPLAAVIGAIEVLREAGDELPQARRDMLHDILHAGVSDLAYITDQLLDAARMGTTWKRTVEPRPLASVLRQVRTQYPQLMQHQTVTMQIAEDAVATVEVGLAERIVANLLHNVDRYCPPGTRVHITGRREGDEVVLTIDDEGPGLAADQLERLQEPLERGAGARYAGRGLGLGLALARGFAEQLGGELDLKSVMGGGTRMLVRLPAADRRLVERS